MSGPRSSTHFMPSWFVAAALVVVTLDPAAAASTPPASAAHLEVPALTKAVDGPSEGRRLASDAGARASEGGSAGAGSLRSPIDAATAAHAAAVQGVKPPSRSNGDTVPGMSRGSPLLSREAYDTERDRIDATFEAETDRCGGLGGNARNVCRAQAGAQRKVARAELDARLKNTDRATYQARQARIESEYEVARQKCGDHSGNSRDSCLREAKATLDKAKTEAQSERPGRRSKDPPQS